MVTVRWGVTDPGLGAAGLGAAGQGWWARKLGSGKTVAEGE